MPALHKNKRRLFPKLDLPFWVSPIVQNPLNLYGNWENPKQNFQDTTVTGLFLPLKIDFRLGTDAEMRELVKQLTKIT